MTFDEQITSQGFNGVIEAADTKLELVKGSVVSEDEGLVLKIMYKQYLGRECKMTIWRNALVLDSSVGRMQIPEISLEQRDPQSLILDYFKFSTVEFSFEELVVKKLKQGLPWHAQVVLPKIAYRVELLVNNSLLVTVTFEENSYKVLWEGEKFTVIAEEKYEESDILLTLIGTMQFAQMWCLERLK